VYHVTTDADGSPGSLRAAVAAANAHPGADQVVFNGSLGDHTITLTGGELLIKDDLTISGLSASMLTVSGGNNSRMFEIKAGTTDKISGLTMTGGNGVAQNPNGAPGEDGTGGAILNLGTLTVAGCTVSKNTASSNGGGIANSGSDTVLTVKNSTVSGNTATINYGGGLFNEAGMVTVSGSTLSGNVAGFQGAGLWNENGAVTVKSSVLSHNSAAVAGGIFNAILSTVTISQSTVSDNSAMGDGGRIYNIGTLSAIRAANRCAKGGIGRRRPLDRRLSALLND
jgi:hypothetical protein